MTTDLILTPVPHRPRTWTVRPATLRIAGDPGDRQLAVVDAGSLGLLSVTLELPVRQEALTAARRQLAEAERCEPEQITLIRADLNPRSADLQLVDAGGGMSVLAEGRPSRAAPHPAVFSSTLTPAQLAVVRRALAGERGLLTATYEIDIPPTGPRVNESESGSSSAEWGGTGTAAGCETTTHHQSATNRPAPTSTSITTDAADWHR